MKKILSLFLFLLISQVLLLCQVLMVQKAHADPALHFAREDNLLIRFPIPEKGVVCSNQKRAERLSKVLSNLDVYEDPWGPKIYRGLYKGEKMFIASVPVGSGSGLLFTELYAAGAKYIIRYGSDDNKDPSEEDKYILKIIDEADNLYGFNLSAGIDENECGKSIFASPRILEALNAEATSRELKVETRVCHHHENFHALRMPEKLSLERRERLMAQLKKISRTDKKESFDMESAVLFRVAKDFDLHAASVLQTINKSDKKLGPYEGHNKQQALEMEKIFIDYLLSALLRIN